MIVWLVLDENDAVCVNRVFASRESAKRSCLSGERPVAFEKVAKDEIDPED